MSYPRAAERPGSELVRAGIRGLCADYPDSYWRRCDAERSYPTEFVDALAAGGWLGASIPEEFGGSGLGVADASAVVEEINRSGGNAAACHAQLYITSVLVRHADPEQQQRYLPALAAGTMRLQAFGVTEPTAGSDTSRIQTTARRDRDDYVINGQKIWTSRAAHSDLLLLLARTAAPSDLDRTAGLSLFLVDLRAATAAGTIEIRPIATMINHATTELFISDLRVPAANLIGAEGAGFRAIIDGWNAERILIAAECIGDGRWFVERGARYARDRVVFGRPIGQNQGVQFPLAKAHASVEAADLMRWNAANRFDDGQPCGPESNMAKYLAAEASWEAANACLDTHGGFGFAAEYDVERKFRETRLYRVAPISQNLVLAYLGHHVLGMPRSY